MVVADRDTPLGCAGNHWVSDGECRHLGLSKRQCKQEGPMRAFADACGGLNTKCDQEEATQSLFDACFGGASGHTSRTHTHRSSRVELKTLCWRSLGQLLQNTSRCVDLLPLELWEICNSEQSSCVNSD